MASQKIIVGIIILSVCGQGPFVCAASKKYNRYLAHLFNKYGTGGTMSFEGLEHLMYNLRLGGLEFGPKHTIEEHHPNGYKIPDLILDDVDSRIEETENNQQIFPVSESTENKTKSNAKQLNRPVNNAHDNDMVEENVEIEVPYEEVSSLDNENIKKTTFKEMHDPKHRHPRHRDEFNTLGDNRCLSPLSLVKLVIDPELHQFNTNTLKVASNKSLKSKRHAVSASDKYESAGIENEEDIAYTSMKITSTTFMKMCPALLVQIEQQVCTQRLVNENSLLHKEGYNVAWIYASISIFIISCCGLVGVAIVPLTKSASYPEILKFLVAVAVGTLCGDAFMHLLPHALDSRLCDASSSEDHGSHNEPVFICGCAFATAIFMYTLETLLPLIKGSSSHTHVHSHSSFPSSSEAKQVINMETLTTDNKHKEINTMLDESKVDEKENKPLSPVAFMVILGDGLHNLTDGLAIGAAFAHDPVTGMATSFAVLCHELPHELGDFALLIKTGVHINRAFFLNIVSSILSFIGMAIGLVLAEWEAGMVRWIYAGTAGSFLYIALTDLIPEMGRDGKHDLKNCLIQIFGIVLGGVIMLFIALYEDNLRILFE